ncbi:hypothetical protein MGSAQ_003046 [marine sediment metagenome]|uniref:Uncharacterized protein n=1 Tax=marine sediment metagenome TaxID=412755 RepID=A0A1B6NQ61_9ZZZZ
MLAIATMFPITMFRMPVIMPVIAVSVIAMILMLRH